MNNTDRWLSFNNRSIDILSNGIPEEIFKNGINHGIRRGELFMEGGFILLDEPAFIDFEHGNFHYGDSMIFRKEKNRTLLTVPGNSRQKLVNNGKRTWPASKNRKGHHTTHSHYKKIFL